MSKSRETVTEKRTTITSSSSGGSSANYEDVGDLKSNFKSTISPRNTVIGRSVMAPHRASYGSDGGTVITRTMEYGYGKNFANMAPGSYEKVSQSGVSNVKNTREREKKDMQDLNERFASYIEKVRFLEAQNRKLGNELEVLKSRWGKETSAIKEMYEMELASARKLIDDLTREKASLEIKNNSLQEQMNELQRQLDDLKRQNQNDRELIAKNNQQLSDYESEIAMLRRTIHSLEQDRARDRDRIDRLGGEVDRLRIDLNNETLNHLDAENRRQSLEEEMEFLKKLHEQELKELAALAYRDTTEENREFWKNELSQAIRDIQSEYDSKVDQIRGDMEAYYNLKVQEFRTGATKTNMEVTHIREENKKLIKQMTDLRGRVADLEARNAHLEKKYQDLLNEYEQLEADHTMETAQYKEEITKMRAEMESILQELQTLMDAKLSLELEILAYRKLLEGEESRADRFRSIIGGISTSRVSAPWRSYQTEYNNAEVEHDDEKTERDITPDEEQKSILDKQPNLPVVDSASDDNKDDDQEDEVVGEDLKKDDDVQDENKKEVEEVDLQQMKETKDVSTEDAAVLSEDTKDGDICGEINNDVPQQNTEVDDEIIDNKNREVANASNVMSSKVDTDQSQKGDEATSPAEEVVTTEEIIIRNETETKDEPVHTARDVQEEDEEEVTTTEEVIVGNKTELKETETETTKKEPHVDSQNISNDGQEEDEEEVITTEEVIVGNKTELKGTDTTKEEPHVDSQNILNNGQEEDEEEVTTTEEVIVGNQKKQKETEVETLSADEKTNNDSKSTPRQDEGGSVVDVAVSKEETVDPQQSDNKSDSHEKDNEDQQVENDEEETVTTEEIVVSQTNDSKTGQLTEEQKAEDANEEITVTEEVIIMKTLDPTVDGAVEDGKSNEVETDEVKTITDKADKGDNDEDVEKSPQEDDEEETVTTEEVIVAAGSTLDARKNDDDDDDEEEVIVTTEEVISVTGSKSQEKENGHAESKQGDIDDDKPIKTDSDEKQNESKIQKDANNESQLVDKKESNDKIGHETKADINSKDVIKTDDGDIKANDIEVKPSNEIPSDGPAINGHIGEDEKPEDDEDDAVSAQSRGASHLSEMVSGYESKGGFSEANDLEDSSMSVKMMRGEVSAKTTYQRTSTGPVSISEVSPEGKFIVLENTSSGVNRREVDLNKWRVARNVDGKKIHTYEFRNYTLKPGKSVKVYAKSAAAEAGLNDLVNRDEDTWGIGQEVNTVLHNEKNEDKATHTQRTLYN